jgi:hypothetical protein
MIPNLDLHTLEKIDSSNPHPIRIYAQTNWSLHESASSFCKMPSVEIMMTAKQIAGLTIEAMWKGVDRWTLIDEDIMPREEGLHRSAQRCKVKWEKLTAEFKKVFNYEKNIPSADDKHSEQSDAKMPLISDVHRSLYDACSHAMVWCVARMRAVNPGNLILDSRIPNNVRQEPKANTNAAYKICDLAYKILKV